MISGQARAFRRLLCRIVWRFARDHHIVHVAFAQAGATDADKAGFLQQFRNGGTTTVAHARLQAADHLMHGYDDAIMEGWSTLSVIAGRTNRVQLGTIHLAQPFRVLC